MKKIIYVLLLSLVSSVAFTSCTKEEIKPQSSFLPPAPIVETGF
jgi:hypothetical protein